MSGRVQKIAATIAAAWVVASASAQAEGVNAGTTVRDRSGWSASLFVAPIERGNYTDDPSMRPVTPPVVNATASRRVAKHARLSFDVINVFDRPTGPVEYLGQSGAWDQAGPSEHYLFHGAEPRGFRLRLRLTF